VVVADAVAVGRNVEACHALHEAVGQPAQPAIAERRVGFEGLDHVEIDAEFVEGRLEGGRQLKIAQGIAQQAADEEFEGEIIDALGAGLVGGPRRIHPAVDDPVAQRQDGGGQPVVLLGNDRILADRIGKLFEDFRSMVFESARRGVGFAMLPTIELRSRS
jgi:hypothetical protein